MSLNQAMERRDGGDLFDWYLMATAEGETGDQESAQAWWNRAESEFATRPIDLTNFVVPQHLDQVREQARRVIQGAQIHQRNRRRGTYLKPFCLEYKRRTARHPLTRDLNGRTRL